MKISTKRPTYSNTLHARNAYINPQRKFFFQFNGKLHLQTYGTAMSTKTAVFLCQHFHDID